MGLYLMEDTKVGDWITRYTTVVSSGDVMTKDECDRRKHSQYRMQVHQNLFLDTDNPKHFEGRFINDARGSRYARFATGYTTNICSDTDYFWVRIYVTKKIKAGDEIFIDYGEDFWSKAQVEALSDPSLLKSVTTLTPSSLWSAPRQSRTSLVNLVTPNQLTSTTTRAQQHPHCNRLHPSNKPKRHSP